MYDVLPDLFQATVRQFGANVAVECDADSLSYRQLEAASNQWANWLRSQGIGCGSRVALWLPRGIAVLWTGRIGFLLLAVTGINAVVLRQEQREDIEAAQAAPGLVSAARRAGASLSPP